MPILIMGANQKIRINLTGGTVVGKMLEKHIKFNGCYSSRLSVKQLALLGEAAAEGFNSLSAHCASPVLVQESDCESGLRGFNFRLAPYLRCVGGNAKQYIKET